ncbi:MAG: hypothetical protein JW908_04215 [Anaerolineales bacterium]|nr:hypothetical protein [Anaerolineales bacterium]
MEIGESNSQLKEEPETPLPQNNSNADKKKREKLRFLFLGYILITVFFIVGIAYALYKSYGIGRSSSPTPTNTQVISAIAGSNFTPTPSHTLLPSPSDTSRPQPSLTFTLVPYPVYMNSPYPLFTENPYPISTQIPITPEPFTPPSGITPGQMTTEPPMTVLSETPQIPTTSFISISTRTPTRIKNPCPCSHDLYDCKDFTTHALAQACYDYCVLTGWGDAHNLDKGGTGIVCKGLP